LIRWLALSQPDPRKALSELVQNSLDADASSIRITRRRERKSPCLFIWDNGAGVIPELDRPDALKYIATHIGHSRKRSLSPRQRLELMTQGQYGIGLLGFWSLGQTLEIRTAVPGQRPHRLVLQRDQENFRIEPLRGRLPLDERWTEVVVTDLHREAQTALIGRRAADYLAAELRGQLLSRGVDVVVEDRMSRGRSQKVIPVRPPRFLGERLEGIGPIEVPDYPPIRFEIYLSGEQNDGDESTGLAVYAAGTLVAESFHELAALELDRDPWTDPRLTGFVDFPAFHVAPGSRRGVAVDQASGAFARALSGVEPILAGVLEAIARRRAEEIDRGLIRDLQRAFRDFYRHRPGYTMLPVRQEASGAAGQGGVGTDDEGFDSAPGAGAGHATVARETAPSAQVDLLPAGPLHEVKLTPSLLRLECLGSRTARARALDVTGRDVDTEVAFDWTLSEEIGTLVVDPLHPERAKLEAGPREGNARLRVVAMSERHEAAAEVDVEVVEELPHGAGGEGIPDPELVNHPGATWRSRMFDGRWQVNAGHREFRAVAERPALKLRYLAMLFAKEVVLRSHQDPRLAKPLEQLVEIAGYADRKLAVRGRKSKRRS
jgi:hypothetical protein